MVSITQVISAGGTVHRYDPFKKQYGSIEGQKIFVYPRKSIIPLPRIHPNGSVQQQKATYTRYACLSRANKKRKWRLSKYPTIGYRN